MKYTFEYKENQISVFQNKLIMTTKDGVENYLVTDKPKNSKKPENLFIQDLETKRALKDKPVATLSYNTLGYKLSKKISLNGLEYFFAYDKKNGFFDRQVSFISKRGFEYNISNVSMREFYYKLMVVLKNRFILGYIASDDKTQNADYYLRYAHKYLLNEKYGFKLEDGVSFIRNISRKSFIPEKYIDGIVNELMKNVYDGEISKSDSILMEAYAKVFLMNEKNAVACFDDKKLHKSVMDQIVDREYSRQLNLIALKEALASTK